MTSFGIGGKVPEPEEDTDKLFVDRTVAAIASDSL